MYIYTSLWQRFLEGKNMRSYLEEEEEEEWEEEEEEEEW
jgi:hypothetical protein